MRECSPTITEPRDDYERRCCPLCYGHSVILYNRQLVLPATLDVSEAQDTWAPYREGVCFVCGLVA